MCRTPLTDQYGRGVLHGELGIGSFEAYLAAVAGAHGGTPPRGSSHFDSGLGRDLRRWCPPLLGLPAHCPPVHYLARRRELGAYAATRALLRGSGIGAFVTDTSAAPAGVAGTNVMPVGAPAGTRDVPMTPAELGLAALGRAREAVSLRELAAQVADTSGSVNAFLGNVAEALHTASHAVAFVSGGAFHEGSAPTPYEVRRAAGRWLRARAARTADPDPDRTGTAPTRGTPAPYGQCAPYGPHAPVPDEPALVRHLLWAALTTGRPVQLHCADPARLRPFLYATGGLGARIVLLPRAPHHRTGAQLAAEFPHVYADAGPWPEQTLAEAPSGKLLFSSDAWALPELYVVAARRFVARTERLLARWTESGACSHAEAVRIARQLAHGNARHVYGLEPAPGGEAARPYPLEAATG
ncbi:amidohydrolase [Streptomyces armeniacus]|uniref:Amidohydrolase n=1 Tax=Streptomyces armeniacus TaxID=83291 RepID=A0A345Y026_9ACTN|nr:amidohydrolase [Streptomyces armeniacus]